jgi:ABC transporter DrrB family efflux protein
MHARLFFQQVWMGLKLYLRIPAALFWIVAFPIVMLMGMGTVFGGDTPPGVTLAWERTGPAGAQDLALQQALQERGVTIEALDPAQAEARWQQGKLAALLEGQGEHTTLRINRYATAQGMQVEALVQQAYLMVQARAQGAAPPARIPVVASSPGGHHDGPYAAYLLPGLLGLTVLMMGVFSTGIVDVTLRAKGGYKRLATTPLPRSIYLGAQLCVRLIVLLVAAALLMLDGALVFGVRNQGSYADLLAVEVLGAACFISLGYVLASFARTPEVYSGIANLVFLPLMLLSGVYFSLDSAPPWLQRAADVLPPTPLLKALRAIFNDGAGIASQAPGLALLAGWTVVLFVLATRRFRWV